ncbi:hypothetical protein HN51_034261 [Arachis hypogaea]|nr:uncharacterized protein DS421_13g394940 [Arachis hypogaea]
MSGLVDRWTSELAKLQQKGDTENDTKSNNSSHQQQVFQEKENKSSSDHGKFIHVNKPRFMFSEASLSMFVECFSP